MYIVQFVTCRNAGVVDVVKGYSGSGGKCWTIIITPIK